MQTPDFIEDVGIVLNALHTERDLPLSGSYSQDSLPTLAESRPSEGLGQSRNEESPGDVSEDGEGDDGEGFEAWPQPPSSLEIQDSGELKEPKQDTSRDVSR